MSRTPESVIIVQWHDVETDAPPEKKLLMVTGDSGYVNNKDFLCLAYYDEQYRPRLGGEIRWQSVTNDSLSDCGWYPKRWAHPINLENVP